MARSTKFSEYCKKNSIDPKKARRRLRLAGYKAPYSLKDKKVLAIIKA